MKNQTRVILRPLEESDLERTHRWHNDPKLYATLGDAFRPVSKVAELEWLRRKAAYSASEINLAICLQPKSQHIGNIYLREINWIARRAVLHIFLGNGDFRGRGFGEQAVRQLLVYAFRGLNLHRIYLETLAANVPAIKTFEKCGFKTEGRLRQHVFKNGGYQDMLVMGLCAEDFEPHALPTSRPDGLPVR